MWRGIKQSPDLRIIQHQDPPFPLVLKFLDPPLVYTCKHRCSDNNKPEISLNLILQGQIFSGNDHRIYLLGNPVIFWGCLVTHVLFVVYCLAHSIKVKRGLQENKAWTSKLPCSTVSVRMTLSTNLVNNAVYFFLCVWVNFDEMWQSNVYIVSFLCLRVLWI